MESKTGREKEWNLFEARKGRIEREYSVRFWERIALCGKFEERIISVVCLVDQSFDVAKTITEIGM